MSLHFRTWGTWGLLTDKKIIPGEWFMINYRYCYMCKHSCEDYFIMSLLIISGTSHCINIIYTPSFWALTIKWISAKACTAVWDAQLVFYQAGGILLIVNQLPRSRYCMLDIMISHCQSPETQVHSWILCGLSYHEPFFLVPLHMLSGIRTCSRFRWTKKQ